jgi:preprotein translocase subunit SecE
MSREDVISTLWLVLIVLLFFGLAVWWANS